MTNGTELHLDDADTLSLPVLGTPDDDSRTVAVTDAAVLVPVPARPPRATVPLTVIPRRSLATRPATLPAFTVTDAPTAPTGGSPIAGRRVPLLLGGLLVLVLGVGAAFWAAGERHPAALRPVTAAEAPAAATPTAPAPPSGLPSPPSHPASAPTSAVASATNPTASPSSPEVTASPAANPPPTEATPTARPTPPARENTTGENLALGQSAVATSSVNAAHGPDKAVDGNPFTRWTSTFSDPQSIQVDLGTRWRINQVRLGWDRTFAQRYTVQISTDGTSWTTVFRTVVGRGGVVTIPVDDRPARFVRMTGTRRASPFGYSLRELEVR